MRMSGDVHFKPVKTEMNGDNRRITLNVGGNRHETLVSTLRRFPGTRLTDFVTSVSVQDKEEYFFDRNPLIFASVLDYYRTGQLHVPSHLCGPMVKAELEFWGLREYSMEPCCWVGYSSSAHALTTLAKFDGADGGPDENETVLHGNCWTRGRACVWKFLDKPYSSRLATGYAWFSLLIVMMSIVVYCLMTHPAFHQHPPISGSAGNNTTEETSRKKAERTDTDIFEGGGWNSFNILVSIDNSCNVFFLLEFIAKIVSAPKKLAFLRVPLTIIEILCILPYYLAIIIFLVWPNNPKIITVVNFLFFWRILRILRIFSLVKHFQALKILVYTVRASLKELFLLVLILFIGMVLFASLIYFAEKDSKVKNDFPHIPKAFWWAVITMTTVGYGDSVPRTDWGYCVGSLCAISGVLVIALTVPVIVNNFSMYYTHAQSTLQLKEHREQRERETSESEATRRELRSDETKEDASTRNCSLRSVNEVSVSRSSIERAVTATDSHISLITIAGEPKGRHHTKITPVNY